MSTFLITLAGVFALGIVALSFVALNYYLRYRQQVVRNGYLMETKRQRDQLVKQREEMFEMAKDLHDTVRKAKGDSADTSSGTSSGSGAPG